MTRAGVFIGVDQTGHLRKLNDAAAGARRMHAWALSQGLVCEKSSFLITDENQKRVTPDDIYGVISNLIKNSAGLEQLIVYFAGHGVNINRSEQWLLSDAPERANAAVDLSGNVELARYCGIGHVVFISDACRVAPEGIQAQRVRGSDIFPNDGVSERANPVDQFFACVLGRTAAEIKDPMLAASEYRALYTDELHKALVGQVPELLEPSDSTDDIAQYVKPVRLENYLERAVPARVRELHLETKVNQNPDAILTAHPHWISRVEQAGVTRPKRSRIGITSPISTGLPQTAPIFSLTDSVVRAAIDGPPEKLAAKLQELRLQPAEPAFRLVETADNIATPFGPDYLESMCGIKVRGARIAHYAAIVPPGDAELLGPDPGSGDNILRLWNLSSPISVLLRFETGRGTVIPALPGFIAALTFEDGDLIDVGYEPSTNTDRWNQYAMRAAELRSLRALAASASRNGRFRLDKVEDPLAIARKMQYAKSIDPTLAIYAAYAYYDLQRIDRIREMISYLREDLRDNAFFDLKLLSRGLVNTHINRNRAVIPFVPMFSQGWRLLRANRVSLHPALDGLESTMRESVWSLFEPPGVDMLERALMSQEVL